MKTLEDLYKENPSEYTQWALRANKENKKLVVKDEAYFLEEIEQPTITYDVKRAHEYPSLQEQLDMLWHDKKDGTNKWFETIENVKNKYPKGE